MRESVREPKQDSEWRVRWYWKSFHISDKDQVTNEGICNKNPSRIASDEWGDIERVCTYRTKTISLMRESLVRTDKLSSHIQNYSKWSSLRRELKWFTFIFSCKDYHTMCHAKRKNIQYTEVGIKLKWAWCLLGFYVLPTSNAISGWVPTYDSAHLWWLLYYCPTVSCWYYDTISHWVALSWYSSDQSLSITINVERQAR